MRTVAELPVIEQKVMIEAVIAEFNMDSEQRDDLTILGVKF
jgi:hypothetical protein